MRVRFWVCPLYAVMGLIAATVLVRSAVPSMQAAEMRFVRTTSPQASAGSTAKKVRNYAGPRPTRSTTIALTSDERRLIVVNREANSISIVQVKDANGNDVAQKLKEISVGQEPRCVAVHPGDRAAYVTNGISGTVSVVDLVQGRVVQQIRVGTEPRGCALTPDGSLLYVANHTEGTVSIIVIPSGTPLSPIPRRGSATSDAIPQRLRSRIRAPATSPRSSSPRSSPNLTLTSRIPFSTAMVKRATSGNKGSSRPSRRAMPIRRSPKSPCAPLADSGFSANRRAPFNFCKHRPPASIQYLLPGPESIWNRPAQHQQPAGGVPQSTPVGADSRQPSVSAQHRRPARAAARSSTRTCRRSSTPWTPMPWRRWRPSTST